MIFIKKQLTSIMILVVLCLISYCLGRSHTKVKIIEAQKDEIIKEVEVIKYVEREKAKIWHKPNADRDDLLKLMRQNNL